MMNTTQQQTKHHLRDRPKGLSTSLALRLPGMFVFVLLMDGAYAFASLRTSSTHSCGTPAFTGLRYRSNDELETLTKKSRWWNPFFAPSDKAASSEGSNRAVDDYLEFLERRYHRLHDSETTGEVKFSAWAWLKNAEDEQLVNQQRQQEDALYVLGVAGLASKKLLQKHERPLDSSKIVEASPAQSEDDLILPAIVSMLMSKVSPLARQIVLRRKLLVRYQARQMNAMAALLTKAFTTGPFKAATALLRMGGGKKNIAVTLTVMAAVTFFILRPLTEILVAVQTA